MIMPQEFKPTRFETILLATNGTESCEGAIKEAIGLAVKNSGKLYAISVVEANREFMANAPDALEKAERKARRNLDAVKSRSKNAGIFCETIVHLGEDPSVFITDEAEKLHADAIVIGRQQSSDIKRLILGSTTANVIGTAPCNVLIVPSSCNIDFKTVLVAVDGSRFSARAAAHAINIAKNLNARLIIVSVVHAESDMMSNISYSDSHRDRIAQEELGIAEDSVKKIKALAIQKGISATGLIFSGRPYEAILSSVQESGADLIVLGSHGRTGLEKVVIGSVAERVVMLAPCVALIARSEV